MKIKEIVGALDRFAPLPLQDGFDNAGLQIGLTEVEVTGALLCLDVTEAVIDEAIALGCNFVVSHHPLIFKGYKRITGRDYVERCIIKALRNDIVIYAAHTNLDNLQGGVNFKMAEKLGLKNVRVLQPKGGILTKLVTFVPKDYADNVRSALFNAGCGCIGNYDSCSYNLNGVGTFKAKEGSHPFCGTIGETHCEEEVRIETVMPTYLKGAAIKALHKAHPYEEPVFDCYTLENEWEQVGSGVIGELEYPEKDLDFLIRVKQCFNVEALRYNRLKGKEVTSIALCGGAGGFLRDEALRQGADVFVTGEIRYHDFLGYDDCLLMADIGHYESEQFTKEIFYTQLRGWFPQLNIQMSNANANPIKYL